MSTGKAEATPWQSYEEREIFTLIGKCSQPNQDRVMELVRSLARATEYAAVTRAVPALDRNHLRVAIRALEMTAKKGQSNSVVQRRLDALKYLRALVTP
jgi:hypothetical protein